MSVLLLAALLVLQDPANEGPLDPATLPRAEEGRWSGIFEGREVVTDELPKELSPRVFEASQAYIRADFSRSIELHFEILREAPDFPLSLLELGSTYFRLRRYSDAAVCLERFLVVAPDQAFRTQSLAHCYYSLGRYPEALDHYRLVLADAPESVEAIRGEALTLYRLGDPGGALAGLGRVLALDPLHAEALLWTAQIHFEEGRSEEALVHAERARDVDRYLPRVWFLLSQVLRDLGREEDADEAQAEWRELDRLVQMARSIEGQLLHRPASFALAMQLVGVQREIGDIDATRDALFRAVRIRPEEVSEVELRIHVLDVLFELGDRQGAAFAARELATACAQSPEAWKRLEEYFARMGDAENQVRAGERYLRLSAGE